jgi:hypothetical protein
VWSAAVNPALAPVPTVIVTVVPPETTALETPFVTSENESDATHVVVAVALHIVSLAVKTTEPPVEIGFVKAIAKVSFVGVTVETR